MCDSSDPLGLYDLLSTVLFRAKENFDRLVPTLSVVGGGSVARVLRASYDSMLALRACFQESERDTRPTTKYLIKINHTAAIAVDIAWEKLHTGAWSDACLAWRELYVVGTLLFVSTALLIESKKNDESTWTFSREDFSKRVQIAALLGIPMYRGALEATLQQVCNALKFGSAANVGERHVEKTTVTNHLTEKVQRPWRIGCKHNSIYPANFMRRRLVRWSSRLPLGSLICDANPIRRPVQQLSRPYPAVSLSTDPLLDDLLGSEPFMMSGVGEGWPALYKWRDPAYLIVSTEDRVVPIECGEHFLHCTWTQKLMSMAEFMENYVRPEKVEPQAAEMANQFHLKQRIRKRRDAMHAFCGRTELQERFDETVFSTCRKGYMAQHDIFEHNPRLLHDLDFPFFCSQGSCTRGHFPMKMIWIGPAGTISPLHTDPHANLFSQIAGYKYVRLYAPRCETNLYRNTTAKYCNSSQIELRGSMMGILSEFPDFFTAPYVDCVLGPGDLLHIPPLHWHYVQSLTSSVSVTMWCRPKYVSRAND